MAVEVMTKYGLRTFNNSELRDRARLIDLGISEEDKHVLAHIEAIASFPNSSVRNFPTAQDAFWHAATALFGALQRLAEKALVEMDREAKR